jgi:hypothetical protein
VVYFSKFDRGGRAASFLLSDWQIAPLLRYETGFPVNPVAGTDISLTGVGLDRPNRVSGVPLYIHGVHTAKLYQWVNPAAFTVPATADGTFGNAGHYMLRQPNYFDIDAAVSRKFKATERFTIETRVEGFNVINHPNFGGPTPSTGVGIGPNVTKSSSNFGRITTAGDQRILQGAFKVIF